jgi:hypothetical protein
MISQYNWLACDNNDKDTDYSVSICKVCNNKSADIFQDEDEYCLDCWQKKTYPNL